MPDEVPDTAYWQAVAEAWRDSDRQPLSPANWRKLLASERPGREFLMTDDERRDLVALPERVTVYRGVNAWNHLSGLSWTLDRQRAEFFALRLSGPLGDPSPWSIVTTACVLRHRILTLSNAREEREVLVFPRYVYNRSYARLA
jgi:hypothetical protein